MAIRRPKSRGRVVGLGLCVADEVLLVDDFELGAERTRYRARAEWPGGMVTTALAQAAALGCDAHLLSLVGDDALGSDLVRTLRAHGVVTSRLKKSADHATTRALVLVDRRSRDRRFVLPDRRAIEGGAPDFDLSPICRGSVLMIDGHFPEQARRAARRAREIGVPVVADLADARPALRRLLPLVDYPILPMEFVRTLGVGDARATLRHIHERCASTPVITQGAKGALALVDGRIRRVRSPKVRVVDTTGAGDVFHGAFAAGLVQGHSILDCLSLAARAAAASCTALGGMAALIRA